MSSSPPPETPADPPLGTATRTSTRWLVLGVIMLVAVPVVWQEVPNEVSRWFDAAAAEHIDAGNIDAAQVSLNDALAWDPRNTEALLRRADLHRAAGNYRDALQDCELALQARPMLTAALSKKSELQHLAGQAEDATAIWKDLLKRAPENPQLLNAVAYGQAVGNIELDEGIRNIGDAIHELGGYEQMLVVFGNMHFVCGERARAFDLFDTAFLIAGAEQRSLEAQLTDDQTYQQQHPIKRRLEEVEAFISETEMHTARLLRRPTTGDKQQPGGIKEWFTQMMDNAQLSAAGFEPRLVMSQASMFASYLDTRGYLHYRRGDIGMAMSDLDVAVEQMELVYDVRLQANEEQGSAQAKAIFAEETKHVTHGLAVMLYHRALVLRQLHREEQADADLQRVEELGFVPGDTLF